METFKICDSRNMEQLTGTGASSLANPLTPQGSIVVTTQFDYSSKGSGSTPQLCNVQRHDLLFRKNETHRYRAMSSLYSAKLKTFAACHSVIHKFDNDNLKQRNMDKWKEDVYKNLSFVGVSNNPVDVGSSRAKEAYIGAIVSGLSTIVNTGPESIEIGDLVIWTLDNIDECHKKGVRMPMSVRPLKRSKHFLSDAIKRVAQKFPSSDPTNKNECTNEQLVDFFSKVQHEATVSAHDRVIGQALSSATPGKAFDILIGVNRR